MTGRVEVSDREIADAVAAVEDEMLELLRRLVEAPTTLGNEVLSMAYARGLGTLYTAVYRPGEGATDYRRPGIVWRPSFDGFREGRRTIRLLATTAA